MKEDKITIRIKDRDPNEYSWFAYYMYELDVCRKKLIEEGRQDVLALLDKDIKENSNYYSWGSSIYNKYFKFEYIEEEKYD